MHTFFKDEPVLLPVVRVAIIAFLVLSIANLYYSIKINKEMADKAKAV